MRHRVGAKVGQVARVGAIVAFSLALAHCGRSNVDPKYGVAASPRVVDAGNPVPKGGGTYRVGKPYVVGGRTYTPEEDSAYAAEGLASWYGEDFHGRQTANGEVFDMHALSAAHPTLPMPSYVRVTNLRNKRSLVVRVNDRGPYHANRVIDLSIGAAKLLGFHQNGVARVRVEYVGRASLDGSDDAKLAATLRHGDTPAPAPSAVMVASNKPFQSEYFDPKPMLGAPAVAVEREAARDETRTARRIQTTTEVVARQPSPAPAARPMLASAASIPAPPPAPRATTLDEQAASFNTRFGTAPMGVAGVRSEPVSAYAPTPAAVVTGRGLY
jgi:rare lipoprotein A